MRVDARESGEVVIVDLEGQLVAGTGDQQLNKLLNELVAGNRKKIVLSLAAVTRLDSSGLGELVAGVQLAKRFGSVIRFVKPQPRVRKVLEVARILPALNLHETEEEAVAAFS